MIGAGSSHLEPLEKRWVTNHIAGMNTIFSHSGLVVMKYQYPKLSRSLRPFPRTHYKETQFSTLKAQISANSAKEILWLALSNDWKYFLSNNQQILPTAPNSQEKWKNMQPTKRSKYDFKRDPLLLTKESQIIIQNKLNQYELQLREIFGNSNIETIYHSSILERKHPNFPNLDMYFTVLNSILHNKLKQITTRGELVNKSNIPIRISFLNVSEQFHKAPNQNQLFNRHQEIQSGFLTHRSPKALTELTEMYNNKINRLKLSKFATGSNPDSKARDDP